MAIRCLHILISDEPKRHERSDRAQEVVALTSQMAKGDENAYRKFYELYFSRLLRYLLVLTHDEEAAREALQRTFLRVVRHARPFGSEEMFWSWLTVLARSSVADESRRLKRYFSFLGRFFTQKQVEAEAAKDETDARLLELMESNLALLPEDDRKLLQRKYLDREPVRQIAERMQLSEKAIESRLVRARQKLKERILEQLNHEK